MAQVVVQPDEQASLHPIGGAPQALHRNRRPETAVPAQKHLVDCAQPGYCALP
jgi:hypothetical protein